jgi:hypothetical protein
LTSNKNDNTYTNIPSKRLKRPDAKFFFPAPTVVNGMNDVDLSSKNFIQQTQFQTG